MGVSSSLNGSKRAQGRATAIDRPQVYCCCTTSVGANQQLMSHSQPTDPAREQLVGRSGATDPARLQLRSAQPEEHETLRKLFAQGMLDAHAQAPELLESVTQYTAQALESDFGDIGLNYTQRGRSACLVAVLDGQVVGLVCLHPVAVGD